MRENYCKEDESMQEVEDSAKEYLYADEPLADQELLREYNKQEKLDEELWKKLEAQIANRYIDL